MTSTPHDPGPPPGYDDDWADPSRPFWQRYRALRFALIGFAASALGLAVCSALGWLS